MRSQEDTGSMKFEYNTVRKEACVEYIEKKSRFIAYVKYIANEEEAIAYINEIKSKNRDARHNVYAYNVHISDDGMNVGHDMNTGDGDTSDSELADRCYARTAVRYSDDGEPQGTAGIPVLETINKNGLSDIVVVVTRYFGGILLGAPGLARAYGKAAALGIEAAGRAVRILCDVVNIKIPYVLLGKIQNELESKKYLNEYFLKEIIYEENVSMIICVKKGLYEQFMAFITEITNSLCEFEKYGSEVITRQL